MKTLLFDFDGVIVDSFQLSYNSMRKNAEKPVDKEVYRRYFDGNIYEAGQMDDQLHESKKEMPTASDPFFKEYMPALTIKEPMPGMIELLQELAKDYRMVIVSSTITQAIEDYLRMHGIFNLFEKLYGADVDMSKFVKINMVFDDFDVIAEDCMFITDTLGDLREANKADVRAVGVTWGFHETETLKKGNPVAIVDSVEELVAVIKKEV